MTVYGKPKRKRGFTLSRVEWDRDGRVRLTVYEPIGRSAPAPPVERASAAPVPVRRGIVAASQDDLFG